MLDEVQFPSTFGSPKEREISPVPKDIIVGLIGSDLSDQLPLKNLECTTINGHPPLAASHIGEDDERTKV